MKLCGLLIGIFAGFAINASRKDKDYSGGDVIFMIVVGILASIAITVFLSMMVPIFAPTTDYDYSFSIYSADPAAKVFVLENNGDTYTYRRKTAHGFRSESIPVDISYIDYSTDGTTKVFVDATKQFDTDSWKHTGFFFFEGDWEPTVIVDKYVITIPEGSIVR